MTAVADRMRRENSLIVDERYMRCPRCRRVHDVLAFVPMGMIEEFRTETAPVYKCPSCHWIFAPVLALSELFPPEVPRGD